MMDINTKHEIVFRCICIVGVEHTNMCPNMSHAMYNMDYTTWGLDKVPRIVRGSRIWTPPDPNNRIDFSQSI